jgi:hypothetical protein
MLIESGGQTIDQSTGEIVEDRYINLDSVEAQLFEALGNELDQKLAQVKALTLIADRQLYRQRTDEDGRTYGSFQLYLKSIEPRMQAIGAGKFRSLLAWITKLKVYHRELGYPETILRQMGSHLDVMLPLAARHLPTSTLLELDEPTEHGKRLGKEHFAEFVREIEGHVLEQDPSIPETSWQVSDTKAKVDEILGKADERAKMDIIAHWVGDKVKADKWQWWVGDYCFTPTDLIPIEQFRKIAKSATVSGLGDNWKD